MSFDSLYLAPELLSTLKQAGYDKPTPIQMLAIPAMQRGTDILASAQTGTGKTASFALPILNQLDTRKKLKANIALNLVLLPTRELAVQVHEQFKIYGANLKLKTCLAYGGVSINPQMISMKNGVHVLIATPGRLLDLIERNCVSLEYLQTLVLDEADRMLDLGFYDDLQQLVSLMPAKRQTVMFSATFSPDIRALARDMLHNPKEIDITPKQTSAKGVAQWLYPVDKKRKHDLFVDLVKSHSIDQCLAFCKTKRSADLLCTLLNRNKLTSVALHGDKSQAQRTTALQQFKDKKADILVATDLAARGIDIDGLPYVVNVDLPKIAEDYVHRIGRTGRAGKQGIAISIVAADEFDELTKIEQILGRHLERRLYDGFEPNHDLPQAKAIRLTPKKPKKLKQKKGPTNNATERSSRHTQRTSSKATKTKPTSTGTKDPSKNLRPGSPFSATAPLRGPRRRKPS